MTPGETRFLRSADLLPAGDEVMTPAEVGQYLADAGATYAATGGTGTVPAPTKRLPTGFQAWLDQMYAYWQVWAAVTDPLPPLPPVPSPGPQSP